MNANILAAALLAAGAVPALGAGRVVTVPVVIPGGALGAAAVSGAAVLSNPSLGRGIAGANALPSILPIMGMETRLFSPGLSPVTPSPAIRPATVRGVSRVQAGAESTPAAVRGTGIRAALGGKVAVLGAANARAKGGIGTGNILDAIFTGGRTPAAVDYRKRGRGRDHGGRAGKDSGTVSYEGVRLSGRAARYFKEVNRLVEEFESRGVGVSESLDVMDDSYGDVWAKLKTIEALAMERSVEDHNTHLERTLTWVDGVMRDRGRTVAVHTHRVYFHAAENPRSEIVEGIARVAGYLDEAKNIFRPGGAAEAALGSFDEVVLAFETRGYAEIKNYVKSREGEFRKAFGNRFTFKFVDELVEVPKTLEETRRELNALIDRYRGEEGLSKIVEGVIYSRYVGLLLELKTVEHFIDRGYALVQSGHELYDENGIYVTELDLVVRSPEGRVSLVEAKSARVALDFEEVLKDKIVRKLETYKKHWARLSQSAGAPIDEVVFSLDTGPNRALRSYLLGKEKKLAEYYGFPVRFLFVESGPADDGSLTPPKKGRKRRRR